MTHWATRALRAPQIQHCFQTKRFPDGLLILMLDVKFYTFIKKLIRLRLHKTNLISLLFEIDHDVKIRKYYGNIINEILQS